MEKKIFSDDMVFEQIKPKSRKAFEKFWKEFNELNPEIIFEEVPPGEEVIVNFFKHPRFEKKVASSSIWTLYSYLNSYRCRVLYGAVGGILWLENGSMCQEYISSSKPTILGMASRLGGFEGIISRHFCTSVLFTGVYQ
jgi:hypothetical protein